MATNQLALYNIALASVGARLLDSLSEYRPERRHLDKLWDAGNGAVNYCLEQGQWNFAMRESSSTAASTGNFNFSYFHDRPSDMVLLSAISEDETFATPLLRYELQSSSVLADTTPLYLRYVSESTVYGGDLAKWPESFVRYVGHWLGLQIAPTALQGADRTVRLDKLERLTTQLLSNARMKDAVQEPARFLPRGSWVRARSNGALITDRGNRSSLTG